ncbi:SsgA family sporulation/cell division regulator [Nonomuraea rhizosphaerae]|uniref:SsgA family sporulation/cell division regulator n=1 Tax=Nonomuraea rhizosphaerae TaxID=2665663 RepID=UPI001C5FE744|nr:SsgA family sporulation/cell division regulator [Nonomuraea rhizosphaerae]
MTRKIRELVLLWDAADPDDKPYAAMLGYRADDPFAVTLLMPSHDSDDVTEIVFARELLIDGLEQPTGAGEVRVEPHIVDRDYITLTCAGRQLFTERVVLERFVAATCALVPSGSECARVNRDLERWLAEAIA